MFLHTRMVSEHDQRRLALWAVMKAILFDVAGEPVVPHGFGQSLNILRQPHPDIRVWIAAHHDPDALAARVNDNREAVEMEVTLVEAVREPACATDVDLA
ncbi:hypothetical protein ACFRJ1_36675 [Streptomyces sp. NPDC056773]|uniref:hypothetical protein n=1 Tax=unclassified Streptomyces TaxID=2593676 RepID=UPI0036B4958D